MGRRQCGRNKTSQRGSRDQWNRRDDCRDLATGIEALTPWIWSRPWLVVEVQRRRSQSGEELGLSARSCPLRDLVINQPDMVLLVATERIRAAWEILPTSRRRELDLPVSLDAQGPISHEQLLRLSKALQDDAEYNALVEHDAAQSPTILSSLLRGTTVYVPPPPKKPEPVRSCVFDANTALLPAIHHNEAYSSDLPVDSRIPRLQSSPSSCG